LFRIRLAQLTVEQRRLLPAYRGQRIRAGPIPGDRDIAESAVAAIYAAVGLPPPGRIVWRPSPLSLARDWLCDSGSGRVGAGANLRGAFMRMLDGARNSIFDAVSASVWREVEDGTTNAAASVCALGVRNSVIVAVDQMKLEWLSRLKYWFDNTLRRTSFRDSGWTLLDSLDNHMSVYRFLGEVVGLSEQVRELEPLWRLSMSTGWIVPHERVCWLSELPVALTTDLSGRLHCGSAAALRWADGASSYCWKGIEIPDWIVNQPNRLTVRTIDCQRNPWVRRCMIEIMTPQRYVEEGGATCVDQDATGKLWRRQWWGPFDDIWAAVEVQNGTPEPDGTYKRYFLQVPANFRSARDAVAWTYGMTASQYAKLVIRT